MNQETSHIQDSENKEQKEKQKMLSLQQKVESVKRLKNIMESMRLDMSLKDITEKLYGHLDEVKKQYAHLGEQIETFNRATQNLRRSETAHEGMYLINVVDELYELRDRVRLNGSEGLSSKEKAVATELIKLEHEEQKHREVLASLLQDKDLAFVMCTQNGIEELIQKFQEIKNIQKAPGQITIDVRHVLNLSKSDDKKISESITKVEYKPYCINVFLKPEFFEKYVDEHSFGMHYLDTPISFIKDDEDKEEVSKTVEHEEVHALLAGFMPEHLVDKETADMDPLMKQLKMEVETRDSLLAQGIDVDAKITLPFYGSENKFIDAQHEEMLADINQVRALNVFKSHTSDELLEAFTSAGDQMLVVMQTLVTLYRKVKNPELKLQLQEMIESLNHKFQLAAFHMNHSLLIGTELGSQFDVEALLLLLKPSQFELTKKYLIHLHGKDACVQASQKLKGNKIKSKKSSKAEKAA